MYSDYGQFHVIRYPTYYVVQDHSIEKRPILFETRVRDKAHAWARKARKVYLEEERAKEGKTS